MSDPLTHCLLFQVTPPLAQAEICHVPPSPSKQAEMAKFASTNHTSAVFITWRNIRDYFGMKHKENKKVNSWTLLQCHKTCSDSLKTLICSIKCAKPYRPPQLTGEPARAQPGSREGSSNEDDYRFGNSDFAPSFLPDYRNCVLKQTECGEALLKAVDTVQMRSQIRRDVPVNEHRAVEQ